MKTSILWDIRFTSAIANAAHWMMLVRPADYDRAVFQWNTLFGKLGIDSLASAHAAPDDWGYPEMYFTFPMGTPNKAAPDLFSIRQRPSQVDVIDFVRAIVRTAEAAGATLAINRDYASQF